MTKLLIWNLTYGHKNASPLRGYVNLKFKTKKTHFCENASQRDSSWACRVQR